MNDLDMAWFIKNSKETWKKHLSPKTWPSAQTIFNYFKTEMAVDPYQMLLESRRTQDIDSILNTLNRFYDRCINQRGLSPDSAKQYCIMMRSFFTANRVMLPRKRKPSIPTVSLSMLQL